MEPKDAPTCHARALLPSTRGPQSPLPPGRGSKGLRSGFIFLVLRKKAAKRRQRRPGGGGGDAPRVSALLMGSVRGRSPEIRFPVPPLLTPGGRVGVEEAAAAAGAGAGVLAWGAECTRFNHSGCFLYFSSLEVCGKGLGCECPSS